MVECVVLTFMNKIDDCCLIVINKFRFWIEWD